MLVPKIHLFFLVQHYNYSWLVLVTNVTYTWFIMAVIKAKLFDMEWPTVSIVFVIFLIFL